MHFVLRHFGVFGCGVQFRKLVKFPLVSQRLQALVSQVMEKKEEEEEENQFMTNQ
jgi:hypothetical protein